MLLLHLPHQAESWEQLGVYTFQSRATRLSIANASPRTERNMQMARLMFPSASPWHILDN